MRDHTLDQTILEIMKCLKAARRTAAGKRTPVEAGHLRRCSMELTRKLADLRQNR